MRVEFSAGRFSAGQNQILKGLRDIQMGQDRGFSGSRKAFLPAFMVAALYSLAAGLTPARAQNTENGKPESPKVILPLQSGFARGGTALYITPEVGVDPSAGPAIVATAQ